ncbi:class I SAM-dependent methyltransferase [Sphingomonas parva]|uniref:Class I SAM-dependent methyltransferase n=1 Tax=Sphingomonas parva TaxID=2555898 RepID=A0A4Y8ZW83_9SPHN|nr:class I SAM-dependent methyltransferase [Sphingomonas parva]TFI60303.1 class I SAM-dependent methyltransferase [Sphingomonas parva]
MNQMADAAARLKAAGLYLGGPDHLFDEGGRKQLMILLHHGLTPDSRLLDIGCGSLRAGHWLIRLLDPDRYYGIEPGFEMVDAGLRALLPAEIVTAKRPRFDTNRDVDFSVFGARFDYVLARSIWTHAPKRAILSMLDGFLTNGAPHAVFLTSFLEPPLPWFDEYRGESWVPPGANVRPGLGNMVRHSFGWIRRACSARGLRVDRVRNRAFAFGGQTWLAIRRDEAPR